MKTTFVIIGLLNSNKASVSDKQVDRLIFVGNHLRRDETPAETGASNAPGVRLELTTR